MPPVIIDLHDHMATRDAILTLNNQSVRETSHLQRSTLDAMIASARVAICVEPAAAFLLAFAEDDAYDGRHFHWFRERYDQFLYIDRVVVGDRHRRAGLGRSLYADLFRRAEHLGQKRVVCEVNATPPNPTSDAFHAAFGFKPVGSATMNGGSKVVRYLMKG